MQDHKSRATFRLVTLGCKANQYDSELIRESLLASGFVPADASSHAVDLCIVNTCTVTHQADAEARQLIRRLARQHPGAAIVVTGCYAARDPEQLAQLPGVRAVVRHPDDLPTVLRRFGVTRWVARIRRFAGHQRAFVRIQDGCLLKCTFCIIPRVRPKLRSRPPEEIEAEVRGLIRSGYREIVLTGIHLGHYGFDAPIRQRTRLWQLVDRLARIEGRWRLRLSSLEAVEVDENLIRVLRDHAGRICPHLHLCLQSGSDRVLRRMRRRYTVAAFLRRVERVLAALDEPAITTDVIVGFPGESNADFEATIAVCRRVGFARIHVFPFSPRAGTPAAAMPDQLPRAVVRARRAALAEVAEELGRRFRQRLVGRTLEVLLERPARDQPGWLRGTAERYVEVRVPDPAGVLQPGTLLKVHAERMAEGHLEGRPVWTEPIERLPRLPVLGNPTAQPA